MTRAQPPRIHPTAVIAPEAELADDVCIGPYAVLEGRVRLGPGCVIRPHVHLVGPLVMGRNNHVCAGAILGERPQHLKYNDEPTGLEIGDGNIFREHVTVHRGTAQSWVTRIGSNNFFMAGSHIAHDCQVGNGCILANGALVGGHCTLADGVYLSGNSALHQFVQVGRLALLSGVSASTRDVPPFAIQQYIDAVAGVNVVGMRRAGMTPLEIDAVRRAFQVIFRLGLLRHNALAQVEQELGGCAPVIELVEFIRASKRGISPFRRPERDAA
jgi:UDP-N-acetylglucosamine acyltransferase